MNSSMRYNTPGLHFPEAGELPEIIGAPEIRQGACRVMSPLVTPFGL